MSRRNPNTGLVVFWVKLRQGGYKRSVTELYRMLRKLEEPRKTLPNPKYVPKPYEKMYYPGQRLQIDVKYVSDTSFTVSLPQKRKFEPETFNVRQLQTFLKALQGDEAEMSAKR